MWLSETLWETAHESEGAHPFTLLTAYKLLDCNNLCNDDENTNYNEDGLSVITI